MQGFSRLSDLFNNAPGEFIGATMRMASTTGEVRRDLVIRLRDVRLVRPIDEGRGAHTPQAAHRQRLPARVVMDLEQQRDQVKLTVTHDEFAPDSKVFASISKGWPLVLSSLKSYLEIGRVVLHAPWYEKAPAAA